MATVGKTIRGTLEHLAVRRLGLDREAASSFALDADLRIRAQCAGETVPKHDRQLLRDVIRSRFDGTPRSRDRICAMLGICRSTFYRNL